MNGQQNIKSTKSCFIISLLYASTRIERYVLIIRRSKFYYTASGIITRVGGRPVHRLRCTLSNISKNQSIYVDDSLSAEIDLSAGKPTPLISNIAQSVTCI